jgi:hypothetical protein
MKLTILWLGAVLLASPAWAGDERPEVLLGLSTDFDAGKVVFSVASSGCTAKADFRAQLNENTLTLFRTRRDSCKAMPSKVPIAFTLKELGLSPNQPFALGNRIIVNENLTER